MSKLKEIMHKNNKRAKDLYLRQDTGWSPFIAEELEEEILKHYVPISEDSKFIEWFENNWEFEHNFAKGDLPSMYKRFRKEI